MSENNKSQTPRDPAKQAENAEQQGGRNRQRYRRQDKRKKHKKNRPEAETENRREIRNEQQVQNTPKKPQTPAEAPQNRENVQQRQRQPQNGGNRDRRRGPRPQDAGRNDRPQETAPDPSVIALDLGGEDSEFAVSREKEEELIAAMPPDPTLDSVFADPEPAPAEPEEGVEIVGVHFPQGAKVYYFDPVGRKIKRGTKVIVETSRGLELGEVALSNRKVPEAEVTGQLKPVVRIATEEDIARNAENIAKEPGAMKICLEKIQFRKLDMKLVGVQYTFDGSKLIVYFTAAQRVDFRELVRDLAQTFRMRIEMRQIGVRDEAKMVGGVGVCGRRLCCSVFLPNYAQVSIKMAKDQGLSLNSAKISGNCGRLLCCLRFEHGTYEAELAKLPTVDSTVETPDGRGRVTDVKPMSGTVKVKLDSAPDAVPGVYRAENIKIIRRAAEKNDPKESGDVPDGN